MGLGHDEFIVQARQNAGNCRLADLTSNRPTVNTGLVHDILKGSQFLDLDYHKEILSAFLEMRAEMVKYGVPKPLHFRVEDRSCKRYAATTTCTSLGTSFDFTE